MRRTDDSLLIAHARLVFTGNDGGDEYAACSIGIRGGWIDYLGTDRPGGYAREVDGGRLLVTPGLINTHHHLYQTLTRGFPESSGQTLFPWLRMLYPIWAGLTDEMIHASTAAGLAELVLSGCTTSADHLYVFPEGSERFMEAQVEAAREIGVRFHPTRGSMDLGEQDGGLPPESVVQRRERILAESEDAIRRFHDPAPGSMLRLGLAPCSPFSVTPELMTESAILARRHGVRLHTHLAETLDEDAYSRERFGVSPVELMERMGWLAPDVWVAHCVHPSESDLVLLGRTGTAVAHCPTSNMLLGSGLAPIVQFRERKIPVGLGVDGSASNDGNDLRNELKQALLVARARDGAGSMSTRAALRLATRGGARCLGRDDIGEIALGKAADLCLFNLDELGFAGGEEDAVAMAVLGAVRPADVIVGGKVVVEDHRLTGRQESDIAARQRRASAALISTASRRPRGFAAPD